MSVGFNKKEIKKEDFIKNGEVFCSKIEICKCNSFTFYFTNGDNLSISCKNIRYIIAQNPEEMIEYFDMDIVNVCNRCANNIAFDLCICGSGIEFTKCKQTENCGKTIQRSYEVIGIKKSKKYNICQ